MMISRSVLLLFVFGLVACGGSGGGSDNPPSTSSASTSSIDSSSVATASSQSSSALASEASSTALSSSSNSSSIESIIPIFGTVYYEGIESIVDVKAVCHDGSDVATLITMNGSGDYGISVKDTALPCFLQAKSKDLSITLHSYVFEHGTANITALTDLTLAFYLNDLPETTFSALQEDVCGTACVLNRDQLNQDESLIGQALATKLYLYDSSFVTSEIIDGDNQSRALSDLSQSIQDSPNLDYSSLLVLIKDGNLNSFPENINAQSSSSSSHSYSSMSSSNESSSVSSSSSSSSSTNDSSLTEGQAFLAANKEKEGVVTTESGLQYRIVTEGTGIKPTVADSVTVHYSGRLLDGTEFDNSYALQQPVSFPVNGVIAGWREALQLMPQGSKWELYIPANLAYGPAGNGPIPPNSTLIFEVELLEVSKW